MLQSMRQGAQSITAKVIIGLIVLSFAAFGLESILPSGSSSSVADVNGEEITLRDLQQAIAQQKQRLIRALGSEIDPVLLDDERLRPRALDSIIQRLLLLQKASDLGLMASASQIGEAITAGDAFRVNGAFSPEAYRDMLTSAGYSLDGFRRLQSEDIVLNQLQMVLTEGDFVTNLELRATANFLAEERDVRFLIIEKDNLIKDSDLIEDALRSYYDSNRSDYLIAEQVVVDYILLEQKDYLVEVDESLVLDQFETVKDEYTSSVQSEVSHILLAKTEDEDDVDYRARIQNVSDRLKAGDDFSGLAKRFSDDLGSASSGGQLGFTDGGVFPTELENAIEQLNNTGEVSPAIETDAGIHFVRLDDREVSTPSDLEEVKNEIRVSIQESQAQRALLIAVEELKDLTFNSADLNDPARVINASVQRSTPFSREEGQGLFSDARVRDLAFTSDVLDDGNNSEVIELFDGRFVVLRLREFMPERVAEFESVRSDVAASLKSALEFDRLETEKSRVLDLFSNGMKLEEAAQLLGLEWRVELSSTRMSSQLPMEVLDVAFSMLEGAQELGVAQLSNGDFALVQLARVIPGNFSKLNELEAERVEELKLSEQQRLSFDEFLLHQHTESQIVVR